MSLVKEALWGSIGVAAKKLGRSAAKHLGEAAGAGAVDKATKKAKDTAFGGKPKKFEYKLPKDLKQDSGSD